MRVNDLIAEMNSRQGQFGTYRELMEWLVTRAESMNWKNRASMSRDKDIITLLKAVTRIVGYRCVFGAHDEPDHPRDDECWYCGKSICEKHCGRRIAIGGSFFSICPQDVPKIDEAELARIAEDLNSEEEEEEEGAQQGQQEENATTTTCQLDSACGK